MLFAAGGHIAAGSHVAAGGHVAVGSHVAAGSHVDAGGHVAAGDHIAASYLSSPIFPSARKSLCFSLRMCVFMVQNLVLGLGLFLRLAFSTLSLFTCLGCDLSSGLM